jgi:prepilin-type N-terminal cleavage/methylation domain-containing protein
MTSRSGQVLLSIQGFTLVEMMFALVIMGMIGTGFSKMLTSTTNVNVYMQKALHLKLIASGTDLLVNDLKEADPSSIAWDSLAPATTSWSEISFKKVSYDMSTPTSPVTTSIFYSYQSPCTGSVTGCLMRNDGAGQLVAMKDLDPPTVDDPLFQQNRTSYHMITLTFLYHPDGQPRTKLVRQVSIKG